MVRALAGAIAAVGLIAVGLPAQAQLGNIFDNLFRTEPPRPPGDVPRRTPPPRGQDYYEPHQQQRLPPPGEPQYLEPQHRLPPPPGDPRHATPAPMPPGSIPSGPLPPGPPPGAPIQMQPLPPPGQAGRPPDSMPPRGLPPPAGQMPMAPGQALPTPPSGAPGAPDAARQAAIPPQRHEEVIVDHTTQRVPNPIAVFAGLDKVTGRITSFDVEIGETVRFGALEVTPRACYTRPPTETPNTHGFVDVDELTLQGELRRIFVGWMFVASPGLSAVEHPIYDVWLTDCKGAKPPAVASGPDAEPPPPPRTQKRTPPRQAAPRR